LVPERSDAIVVVPNGHPVLAIFVASGHTTLDARIIRNTFHRSEVGWMRQSITPLGRHYLILIERDGFASRSAVLLDQAFVRSFDGALKSDGNGTAHTCTGVVDASTSPSIRAAIGRGDEVTLGTLASADGHFEPGCGAEANSDAIGYILN
jgi:hypothetical protein